MLTNVCRFKDTNNEKTQHVTSPVALLSSMYCSKYDSLKYIHCTEALVPHFNDLAIGCCILSRSTQYPSHHTITILQQWVVSFTKYSIYVFRKLAEKKMEGLPHQSQRIKFMHLDKDFEHIPARDICLNKIFGKQQMNLNYIKSKKKRCFFRKRTYKKYTNWVVHYLLLVMLDSTYSMIYIPVISQRPNKF